jgi:hypothetical protein
MDYGARMYAPGIGRFISADSIVPGAGNPQSLNRYSYVNNRPLNMVDPTGHAQQNPDDNGGWCSKECKAEKTFNVAYETVLNLYGAGSITVPSPFPKGGSGAGEKAILLATILATIKTLTERISIDQNDDDWEFVGYHGTSSEYVPSLMVGVTDVPSSMKKFGGQGQLGRGFYTTPDLDAANTFAKLSAEATDGKPVVLGVWVKGFSKMKGQYVDRNGWWKPIPSKYMNNADYLYSAIDGYEQWKQIKFNPSAYAQIKVAPIMLQ